MTELQSDLRFMTAKCWSLSLWCENMPLLLATGERPLTVCRRSPDHPLSQNKREHVTAPAPARHAFLLLYVRKDHLTVYIMQLPLFGSQAELIQKTLLSCETKLIWK